MEDPMEISRRELFVEDETPAVCSPFPR